MAGINLARRLIRENRHVGKVIAKGKTKDQDLFMILKIVNDQGTETVFDYGGDIMFDSKIKIGDRVKLRMVNNNMAEWRRRP